LKADIRIVGPVLDRDPCRDLRRRDVGSPTVDQHLVFNSTFTSEWRAALPASCRSLPEPTAGHRIRQRRSRSTHLRRSSQESVRNQVLVLAREWRSKSSHPHHRNQSVTRDRPPGTGLLFRPAWPESEDQDRSRSSPEYVSSRLRRQTRALIQFARTTLPLNKSQGYDANRGS